jgi:hypothetical protein
LPVVLKAKAACSRPVLCDRERCQKYGRLCAEQPAILVSLFLYKIVKGKYLPITNMSTTLHEDRYAAGKIIYWARSGHLLLNLSSHLITSLKL